jgi:DNA polymerase-1
VQHITRTLGGDPVDIYVVEEPRDLAAFDDFLAQGDKVLGFDTETTDLNIYSHDFGGRLAQFGNRDVAFVLPMERFGPAISRALRQPRHFTVHNAAFDLLVVDRVLGVTVEELGSRVFDTRIMAHLLDPRQRHEGGAGLGLKELSEIYVDPEAPDTQAGLHAVFRSLGLTKETGWRQIDLFHPTYLEYAGLDPILARRLFDELAGMIKALDLNHLSQFEHHLQTLLAIMQRRGMRLDMDYVRDLRGDLDREAEHYRKIAARYGVENVNSTAQVADALVGMGETLTERSPKTGAWKVDKGVLLPLADMGVKWDRLEVREPNPLAEAVLHAKRAAKWQTSYVDAFVDLRDEHDRIHPRIGGLQARTARMSVSTPPLQQLPSGDWKIRRAIVADPGNVYASIDYQAVELRVLAAIADVSEMKRAIAAGEDLHGFTARLVYGDTFTKAQRGLMKGVGFGKVYGGGATTLARQTGAPIDQVKHAIAEYDRVYPEVKRYSKRLQHRAEYGKKEVVTLSGRHLPLDRDRLFAATNYVVQSTARDLLAQAIVDVADAGLLDYLRLPIHDELLVEVPGGPEGEEIVRDIARLMESDFQGVPIQTDPELGGRSWGSMYGADQ